MNWKFLKFITFVRYLFLAPYEYTDIETNEFYNDAVCIGFLLFAQHQLQHDMSNSIYCIELQSANRANVPLPRD